MTRVVTWSALLFALLIPASILAPAPGIPLSTAVARFDAAVPPAGESASDEEFVGPFPSWANLKEKYGAVGDGVADDSRALQRAMDELGQTGASPVLFLPAGRYRLTRTITIASRLAVTIAGEHPASVTLLWDGPPGGTILSLNGVAYSRVTRLTFDGGGKAMAAVEQSWDGQRPNFDTGNEYSDVVFAGAEYGLRGGFLGHGFAEVSIMRARFVGNTRAGVALGNFNALDVWIRHSVFEDCAVGVTNDPGAGNFRIYDSIFRRSSVADAAMQNTGGFSLRGNYSIGSKAFFVSGPAINHPATIAIQNNTIVDPQDATAIHLANQGPGVLVDNVIRSRADATGPAVMWRSFIDSDLVSIGNTFTVPTPVFNNGRLVVFDDRTVPRDGVDAAEPALPGVRPNLQRPTIDLAAGSDRQQIQTAIDRAAARSGTRPVVHLPFGRYEIDEPLEIPAADLQIVGDGPGTVLAWSGSGEGPVLRVHGPSRATLRELTVRGTDRADGLVADDLDRDGSRVYLEGTQLTGALDSNLRIEGLARARVEAIDVNHAQARNGASVKVIGSNLAIFSGASSNNPLSYEVSGGGELLVRDVWYEGGGARGFLAAHDRASAIVDGGRVSTVPDAAVAAVTATDLDGRVVLLATHFDDRIVVNGGGTRAEIVALALFREFREAPFFENATAPQAAALLLNARQRARHSGSLSPGSVRVADVGTPDPALIRRALAEVRARRAPVPLTVSHAGASDLRLFRVAVGDSRNNVVLR